MENTEFLKAIHMGIAYSGVLKKDLAERCGGLAPQFSEMIHGIRRMTEAVKDTLISELELKPHQVFLQKIQDIINGLSKNQ